MSTGYDWDGEEIQKLRTDKENLAKKVAMLEQEINATRQAQAAEIIRLQAELATAIKWRDAINDALTSWHNPVDEEETPREAVDRLIGYETAWERLSAPNEAAALDAIDAKRGFAGLIGRAYAEAEKAMRKFPQPNYTISKIAEEAGEVVKAAIHCAEGRDTATNIESEMRQLIAMLYRLWIEGDQVHGLEPVCEAIGKEQRREAFDANTVTLLPGGHGFIF